MELFEIKEYKELASGENTNQSASIGSLEGEIDYEIVSHNKDLTYTDIINLSAVLKVMGEFFDVACNVISNSGVICAVSLGKDSYDAYIKNSETDPLSIVGATVGFTKTINLELAKLLHSMKIKNIITSNFDKDAYQYLLDTNINLIKINTLLHEIQGFSAKDIKITPFGALVQDRNLNMLSKENFNVVSEYKPTKEQLEDAIFAWKISKHLLSHSAVIAKDLCAKSIAQGFANQVEACEYALNKACENSKDSILAVDGIIENQACINASIQGRISVIIESGGGKSSRQLLDFANKYGLGIIFTGLTNYKFFN